jgi:ComF family protein
MGEAVGAGPYGGRVLLPRRCPLCDRPGAAPCAECARDLRHAGTVPAPAGVDTFRALFAYEGAVRALLLSLKYGNRRDALRWLGSQLATRVPQPVDVVTWAPTSSARAGRRGYDQAELLARASARVLRLRARGLLRRAPGHAQTGLGAQARRVAPVFHAARAARGSVLLVDDVATTGATLTAAAHALRLAGAREVHAVVVARTPRASTGADMAGLGTSAAGPRGGTACRSPSAAGRRW